MSESGTKKASELVSKRGKQGRRKRVRELRRGRRKGAI